MLYKYVGAENGKQALEVLKYFCEAYTLKASEPTSFNDPFEFKIVADFEATPAESNPKTVRRYSKLQSAWAGTRPFAAPQRVRVGTGKVLGTAADPASQIGRAHV